ncbi:MAG: ABC transporter ATP-binding protein [Acidobacteria bacterium]|nr:ABC transporter ATP-binding protein [Acidobacteriota bacterium]MBK8147226.1 ABC transporter ATP-binding protein [Acidobacteriota bacterium]
MLSVENISVAYAETPIVSGVSLELVPGKTIALVGANGAGKTTLLKALNGTLPLAAGTILLGDRRLADYSRREIARMVAVVAQETETSFPVSALEFVLAGRFAHGAAFGWESAADHSVARTALELCDLKGYESRLMNKLSGGERQRVVLARALATEARILLLDEPTANLDLAHQAMMFRLVRERCRTCESSAIIITHDLNLASEFADEVILLERGRIVAKGAPREVLTRENIQRVFDVNVLLDENPVSRNVRVTTVY